MVDSAGSAAGGNVGAARTFTTSLRARHEHPRVALRTVDVPDRELPSPPRRRRLARKVWRPPETCSTWTRTSSAPARGTSHRCGLPNLSSFPPARAKARVSLPCRRPYRPGMQVDSRRIAPPRYTYIVRKGGAGPRRFSSGHCRRANRCRRMLRRAAARPLLACPRQSSSPFPRRAQRHESHARRFSCRTRTRAAHP